MAWWVKKDLSYLGPDFDWVDGSGPVQSGLSSSCKVEARHVPKAARCRRPAKKPPSHDIFIVDYSVACTGRFKALVEEFEPGLHLFVPIDLQFDDGAAMPGEFYFFNCNVDVDCLLTDNKSYWFGEYGKRIFPMMPSIQKRTSFEISLSKPQIEGRHLWTGGVLGWNQLFVSDAFCEALRKGRFRAIEIWRECHEVDRPWVADEHMGPLLDEWEAYVSAGRNLELGWP